jgi:hypothetical protein
LQRLQALIPQESGFDAGFVVNFFDLRTPGSVIHYGWHESTPGPVDIGSVVDTAGGRWLAGWRPFAG